MTTKELQHLLFNAVKSNNRKALNGLCRKHQKQIQDHFPEWKVAPKAYRNEASAQHYVNMMVWVAEYFAKKGDNSLMEVLNLGEADDMFHRWGETLMHTGQLNEAGKHDEALSALKELQAELDPMMGSAKDQAMATLYGQMGQAYLGKGDPYEARPYLMQGYDLCQKTGNIQGLIMIIQDLAEVAALRGLSAEERHWRIVMTNILIQVGNKDGAIQVRQHFGITPYDELIETTYQVE